MLNTDKLEDIQISCRNCSNFVLFNRDHNSLKVLHRQGFCLYGQLEGDWSPYIGSSQAKTCKAYIYCSELNQIYQEEQRLYKQLAELLRKITDRIVL